MKNLLSTYDERMMAIYLASAKCAVDDVTGEDEYKPSIALTARMG